jgi:hypothetical protein
MAVRRYARWLLRASLVLLGVGVGPAVVSAHDIAGSRFDAPIPLPLLLAGAGATVALTALWLAVTDRKRTPDERRRHVFTVSRSLAEPLQIASKGLFLAVVGVAIAVGVLGRQVAATNLATVFTWPVWFRGLALLALVVGNPWQFLSPWRTIYDALVRLEGRPFALLGTYPTALGDWPAVVGFIVLIGFVENLTVIPQSPRLTAVTLAVYALVMLGGVLLYGETWLSRVDPLGAFYRLFGRVGALASSKTDEGGFRVAIRPPWQGCLSPLRSTALVVFVVTLVYTVSFDGFTETRLFQTLLFGTRDVFRTGPGTSVLIYLGGLVGFVGLFGAGSWLADRLGTPKTESWVDAMRWFAPTVLPIAGAYEVAHNYPYVIRNLGQLLVIGTQWVPGTAGEVQLLGWLSLPLFWGSQVVLIVLGHVIAVVAAHNVALDRYKSRRAARQGHFPLVVLMIGFTVVSLWIISQPVVTG